MTAAAAGHSGTIPRAAAVSADELDVPDVIDDAHISRTRASMMAALADAVTAHELAADHLGSRRGPLCDLDLSDRRDGHDLVARSQEGLEGRDRKRRSSKEDNAKRRAAYHLPARLSLRIFRTIRSRLMPRRRSTKSVPSR